VKYNPMEVWDKYYEDNPKKVFRRSKQGVATIGFDTCGALIEKSAYGDGNSLYGWEVDNLLPEPHRGGGRWGVLRPLHWANYEARADSDEDEFDCAVEAREDTDRKDRWYNYDLENDCELTLDD